MLPFNSSEASLESDKAEVRTALEALDPTNLLFLSHLKRVDVITRGGRRRSCRRADRGGQPHTVDLTVETADSSEQQRWWLFQSEVVIDGATARPLQIAFKLDESGSAPCVLTRSPLAVFFPTEKETGLGFLLQGPFRTTPARDNVPAADPWNQDLVRRAGALVVASLRKLKSLQLLTPAVLSTLPIRSESFPTESMFRPLFDHVATALRHEALLPTDQDGFAEGDRLRIARSSALRQLFNGSSLGRLLGSDKDIHWVSGAITTDRTHDLHRYLREWLDISEVTPDIVLARLSRDFLQAQSDDWLCRFYALLDPSPALYRAPRGSWDTGGPARAKPIIRLEDGSMVPPFDTLGKPQAYLPRFNSDTRFPTIRAQVAKDASAELFLRKMGLTEPDAVAEVLEFVLPRYAATHVASDDEVLRDMTHIARAMEDAQGESRKKLLAALRESRFVRCRNTLGEISFERPTTAYFPSNELLAYFDRNRMGLFVDDIYEHWMSLLRELGCSDFVRITSRKVNALGHVTLASTHGWHRAGSRSVRPGSTN